MKKLNMYYKSLNYRHAISLVLLLIASALFALLVVNATPIKLSVNRFNKLPNYQTQLYVLDVGQANANLIIFPNKVTMLIDTGTEGSAKRLTKQLNYILDKNNLDNVIDYVVLTHPDADHVGGFIDVLRNFNVSNVFRPKLLAQCEANLSYQLNYPVVYNDFYDDAIYAANHQAACHVQFTEDETYYIKSSRMQFYTCKDEASTETNYHSPIIVVKEAGKTIMLTGDATKQRELEFLQDLKEANETCHVDFLVVAHHGSNTSTCQQFLDAVQPTYALISASDNEHPSQHVLNRLQKSGTKQILCTKNDGMIGLGLQEDGNFQFYTCRVKVDVPLWGVVIYCVTFLIIKLYMSKTKKIF